MSVVTLKSTVITNRDATPKVLTDNLISGGEVRQSEGYVTTGSADSANSIYKLCQVPSNARLTGITINNEALGTGCTLDIGAYYPTTIPLGGGSFLSPSVAGTAISAAFFASQYDAHAATTEVNVTNQSGSYTIDKQEMPLWQALGLSADPECVIDICITVHVATASAGRVSLKASYVQ